MDCCIDRPESRAQWEGIFESQLEGLPILRVIVTHMHPDHVGLAHWITARFGSPEQPCRLWMSATDWYTARLGSQSEHGLSGQESIDFYRQHGVTDQAALQDMRQRRGRFRELVPAVPDRFARLLDGLELTIGGRTWRCIVGYGHAQIGRAHV